MDSLADICQTQSLLMVRQICEDRPFTVDEITAAVEVASRCDELDLFYWMCDNYRAQIYFNLHSLWRTAFSDGNLVMLRHLSHLFSVGDHDMTLAYIDDANIASVVWYIDNLITAENINSVCPYLLRHPLSSTQRQYLINHPSLDFSINYRFQYAYYDMATLEMIINHDNYVRPDPGDIRCILRKVGNVGTVAAFEYLATAWEATARGATLNREYGIAMLVGAVLNTPEMCDYITHKYDLLDLVVGDLTSTVANHINKYRRQQFINMPAENLRWILDNIPRNVVDMIYASFIGETFYQHCSIVQLQMWCEYQNIVIRPEKYNLLFKHILDKRNTDTNFVMAVIKLWQLADTPQFQCGSYCSLSLGWCVTAADYDECVVQCNAIIDTTRAMWRLIDNVIQPCDTLVIINQICRLQYDSRILTPETIALAMEIAATSAHLPMFTIVYVDYGVLRAVLTSRIDYQGDTGQYDLLAWPIPGTDYQYHARVANDAVANHVASIIHDSNQKSARS